MNLTKKHTAWQVLAVTLASLMATTGIVAAATTIGDNINTGGTLSVTGTSTMIGAVTAPGGIIGTSTGADYATLADNANSLGGTSSSAYLLRDGSLPMFGNLNLSGFQVTNGGTYNGTSTGATFAAYATNANIAVTAATATDALNLNGVAAASHFLVDGSRVMTGNLDLSNNNVLNGGTYNGTSTGATFAAQAIIANSATNALSLGGVAAANYAQLSGASFAGSISVGGQATTSPITGDILTNGDVYARGSIGAVGDLLANGDLIIGGSALVSGLATTSGVTGDIATEGNVSAGGAILANNAVLTTDLVAGGDIVVNGMATTSGVTGNISTEGTVTATNGLMGSSVTTASLTINSGTAIIGHLSASSSLDFGNLASSTAACETLTLTVTGATVGSNVYASPHTTVEAGLIWSAYVSALNTVSVRLCNIEEAAVNPAAVLWRADVWKH